MQSTLPVLGYSAKSAVIELAALRTLFRGDSRTARPAERECVVPLNSWRGTSSPPMLGEG
eukprot:5393697-Alexandrium_andersonii.AAC.1